MCNPLANPHRPTRYIPRRTLLEEQQQQQQQEEKGGGLQEGLMEDEVIKTPAWLARWIEETKKESHERRVGMIDANDPSVGNQKGKGDKNEEKDVLSIVGDLLDAGLCCAVLLSVAGLSLAKKQST